MTAAEWSDGAAGPVLNLFAELTEPDGDWQDRARCAETDPEAFFPAKGKPNTAARRVCRNCEVRGPCLEYALEIEARPETTGRHGLWADTSPKQREDIARERREARERTAA